jgi:hypothetical protein
VKEINTQREQSTKRVRATDWEIKREREKNEEKLTTTNKKYR